MRQEKPHLFFIHLLRFLAFSDFSASRRHHSVSASYFGEGIAVNNIYKYWMGSRFLFPTLREWLVGRIKYCGSFPLMYKIKLYIPLANDSPTGVCIASGSP